MKILSNTGAFYWVGAKYDICLSNDFKNQELEAFDLQRRGMRVRNHVNVK